MKYRATIAGFIDRLIQPGDVVECNGPPPILGLVPIDEPVAEPVAEIAEQKPARSKRARAAPGDAAPAGDDEVADVI